MLFFTFKPNFVYPAINLPLTLISLEDWSCVTVTGKDSQKYLQDQLTIDVFALQKNHYTLCAHCNFNGKVWSTMHFFHYKKGYAYILRTSVADNQIKELKKYSVFSKVEIRKENNIALLGLAGLSAKKFLLNLFPQIPDEQNPIIVIKGITILWFKKPFDRFLLILSWEEACILKNNIKKYIFLNNSQQWLLLDIESGFPIIDKNSSEKFVPQAINLERFQAINFKKGCYYGQEMISRIFFKNLNKRFLCCLKSKGRIFPPIGARIEIEIEKEWHKIGVLLSFVHVHHLEICIQVVLNYPIDTTNIFRIYGYNNIFFTRK